MFITIVRTLGSDLLTSDHQFQHVNHANVTERVDHESLVTTIYRISLLVMPFSLITDPLPKQKDD